MFVMIIVKLMIRAFFVLKSWNALYYKTNSHLLFFWRKIEKP